MAKHKHKGSSLQGVISTIGSDPEAMTKFLGYAKALIEFFIAHNGRHAYVSWGTLDTRVVSVLSQNKVEVCEADDELWDYAYYVRKKGDPKYNGLGHVETWDHGRHEVRVPTAPIRRVKRSSTKMSARRTIGARSFMRDRSTI